jgi:ribonuclease HI
MSIYPNQNTTHIYSDGACLVNPGKGGYGVVIIEGETRKELMGAFIRTTNNRMEILAAIVGLEALANPSTVRLYSDSKYLVDSMAKGWVERWKGNNWKSAKKKKVPNTDLWKRLLAQDNIHNVDFIWVKGHAGNTENEKSDELSYLAIDVCELQVDSGYIETAGSNKQQLVKIEYAGQLCRKCFTQVVQKTPKAKRRPGQEYYFEYYLHCPGCGTNYFVERAKIYIDN